jgi:hypothetical protein
MCDENLTLAKQLVRLRYKVNVNVAFESPKTK